MKIFKIMFLIAAISILYSCASLTGYHFAPSKIESADKNISYNYDEFDKAGWLKSGNYLSESENPFDDMITYMYRARFDSDDKLSFIQIYFMYRGSSWLFIDEVKDDTGKSYEFVKVDREVNSAANVEEFFAININLEDLKKFSENGVRLKFDGKKGSEIRKLSPVVSKSFLNALTEKL